MANAGPLKAHWQFAVRMHRALNVCLMQHCPPQTCKLNLMVTGQPQLDLPVHLRENYLQ